MENVSFEEVFSKLTKEQKEAFDKMFKKYNGLPNLFQIISEIKNIGNTDVEKQLYDSALISVALALKGKMEDNEKEDGKVHSYRVAMRCGGLMESPKIYYENEQIITAKSRREAVEKYNYINDCNYFYGEVLAQLD